MELKGNLGGYDFVGRVRFGNRNAIADGGGGERPVRPVPQNRKIAKSINFESIMKGIKIAEVLKTRMTNLKSSMSAEIRY